MALIVENGTGLVDAESFASVADATTRHLNNGMTIWATLATEEMEQALRRATNYVNSVFRTRWKGEPATVTQALTWPRADVEIDGVAFSETSIPKELIAATCEYALIAAAGPLMPTPVVDDTGFNVVTVKKVIGPIEKEFQAMGQSSKPSLIRSYPVADVLIAPLLGASSLRVTR